MKQVSSRAAFDTLDTREERQREEPRQRDEERDSEWMAWVEKGKKRSL